MYLFRGSTHKKEIIVLQNTLFQIGYGTALNWSDFGADGGYGESTETAVLAFANKNDFETDGQTVSIEMFKKIVELNNVVRHLRTLNQSIEDNKGITENSSTSTVTALQNMLHFLGFDEELNWERFGADGIFGNSSIAATTAFATKEALEFDGETVSIEILQKMLSFYESGFGDDWKTVEEQGSLDDIIVKQNGNIFNVSDGNLSIQFKRVRFQSFRGLKTDGQQEVIDFLNEHAEFLEDNDVSDSSINVMRAVSVNEGKLDGINTYDSAFLSFGIFQWTLGQRDGKGELPALLKKIKTGNPGIFHKYFGAFGLDVSDRHTNSTYGYLTLNNNLVKSTRMKDQFRGPIWAFVFWRAGQDKIIKAYEIDHALARLKNFYWRKKINGKAIADYITSEFGVALLLDQNVNRPNDVYSCTRDAVNATGLANKTLTTADERKLLASYINIRNRTSMHDPNGRANRTRAFLTKGIISDERLSFQINAVVAKGLSDSSLEPFNFNQEHYPEIEE